MIEHLATPVRQAWLRRATELLRPGGHGLTVDSVESVRALPATRVDVALIAARRPAAAAGRHD